MAYCPKCGVEVDDDIRSCPLCSFPIPDIRGHAEEEGSQPAQERYPVPSNIYREHRQAVKNQILFVYSTVAVSAMIVLVVIRNIKPELGNIALYVFICVLSSVPYLFFILGFLRRALSISGLFLTTVLLTKMLSSMGSGPEWFLPLALPIIIWIFLNVLAFDFIYLHSKKRDRVGYIPSFALLFSSSICVGIDGIVSLYMRGTISFSWSLIVAASCLSVSFVLQMVIRILPDRIKNTISRKMHL